ncbi:MAG: hypothetical protein WBP12_04305 [Candidatus Saccharimonas sp.]
MVCARPVQNTSHLCKLCRPAYKRAWCIGKRDEALRELIDQFKFERVGAARRELVDLLDQSLPLLPSDVIVVPVPTIAKHRRIRGYGHVELIAKAFSRKRQLIYQEALGRHGQSIQRGASRRERIEQAKLAYQPQYVQIGATYLLVDDVYTTGATLEYASQTLLAGGAKEVWVVALSRQPLEK